MSYETYGLNDTIKQIQREMAIIRESIPISGEFVGLDQSGHGLGSTSDNVPIIEGVTSWQPQEVTLEGSPEDQILVASTTVIVNGTGNTLTLRTILGTQHNGQLVTIKPKEGKTLSIVTGGNIDVSSTITLSDNQYVIFQYFEDAGNKYLVLQTGNSSGMNNPATVDLDMATFDITSIDALKFGIGTSSDDALAGSDYGIEVLGGTSPQGIVTNVPTGKGIFWSVNGVTRTYINVDQWYLTSGTYLNMNTNFIEFERVSSPSNPASNHVRLFLDSDNSDQLTVRHTDGSEVNLEADATGVALDDDPVWAGKHVWDNTTTWLGSYDTDSEKATNCHAKFQGDGLRHQTYNSGTGVWDWDSGYDDDSTQRVLEIGKYGSHEVKIIAEVTGEGDAIITDPDGSGSYTIPNSDPSISFKASLVMNTYTMYDLDTLVFSQGASTTTPPPLDSWVYIEADTGTSGSPVLTGMKYNVPSGKTHQFSVDGTDVLTIDANGIVGGGSSWVGTATSDLAMATFDITGVDSLKFSTNANSSNVLGNTEYGIEIEGAPSSPSRLKFNVPSGKSFSFQVNGSIISSISNLGKGTFNDGVNIGGSTNGLIINDSSGNPFVNGHFRTNGTDVKVYSGGAVRNMSDIGSGGGSGADTALSNLTSTGEGHFDSRYGRKESGNSVTIGAAWTMAGSPFKLGNQNSDDIQLKGKLNVTDNYTNWTGSPPSLVFGFITIIVGGTARKLYYYG